MSTFNTDTPPPVRCPSCRRVLQPPRNAARFRCPCNQILKAPAKRTHFLRCPKCRKTLSPPVGSTTFRCPCGVALRNPRAVSRGLISETLSRNAMAGGGTYVSDTLMPKEIAKQLRKPNEEHWVRKMTGHMQMGWVRVPSEEQSNQMQKLLKDFQVDMVTKIYSHDPDDLRLKLEQLGLLKDMADSDDVKQLQAKLLGSTEFFLRKCNTIRVKKLLSNLHIAHTGCSEHLDYVELLVAAVWYGPNRFSDGLVREFNGQFSLDVIPAQQYSLKLDYPSNGVNPLEIERVSQLQFQDKVKWFHEKCHKARISWDQGKLQVKVRRADLLMTSYDSFFELAKSDLRKFIRVDFIGEDGIDAGGLTKEWFELVTDACFNVDCGLFEYSGVDNICYQINPASGFANDMHEKYFHFLGRVVGKALFEQVHIRAHLTQPLYKHILGSPLSMRDIEYSNSRLYESLKEMEEVEDVSDYMLTFTATHEMFGETKEINLKPNGGEIEVTNNNLQEYIQLLTKHIMFERTKSQLAHFLRGIYDVIPTDWLAVFDYRELELLLCGLPNINVQDWKQNTRYKGRYQSQGSSHRTVHWFWEFIEASSQERRAMILQYCTGTSRVPVQGFSALQGNDGNIKPFTIELVEVAKVMYPKAHTCFNRIELPMYRTKRELVLRFEEALTQGSTGFSDE